MPYQVNLPAFRKVVNEPFKDLFKDDNRLLLLWGGRGSGKSVAAVRLLIYRALTEPYFKCVLIRKVYDTIGESMHEAIKDEVEALGLSSLFTFIKSPLEIRCINGAKFICRGLDKPEKIRSLKEPAFVWYEEGNQITEEDYINVTSTVRGARARILQEVFTFNPEPEGGDFKEYWLYKYFFEGHHEKTFKSSIDVTIVEDGKPKVVTMGYTSVHSTYKDNPHYPAQAKAQIEQLKNRSPYYYKVFALGEWGNKEVGNLFYKGFTLDQVSPVEYNPEKPLHISFDENVNPYLTLTIHQVEGLHVKQVDEITLINPNNTVRATCNEFKRRYADHSEGIYIYGDRTSKKQDAKLEKGQNFYTIIEEMLKQYRPTLRIPSKNPNVKSRGDFLNDVFSGMYEGLSFTVGDNCTNTIADYLNLQEAADGTKSKAKVRDKRTGVSYEQYGHTSDANDYLLIELYKAAYSSYINGARTLNPVIGGLRSI